MSNIKTLNDLNTPKKRKSQSSSYSPSPMKRESSNPKGVFKGKGVSLKSVKKNDGDKNNRVVTLIKPRPDTENRQTKQAREQQMMMESTDDEDIDESKIELPDWMKDNYIKDKQGRKKNEQGYDPSTIHIPIAEKQQSPPIIRQYLEAKANHWDKVVAFKVWKFYYFYYKDALIVKKVCDIPLHFKKKRFFCFFPESSLPKFAPMIVEQGHKLVLVEQMEETVEKQTDLIRRDVCQILTRGTYFENQELGFSSQYLLCVLQEENSYDFGVVFLDASTHEFNVGQFTDDRNYSHIRTLLTRHKPVEIIYVKEKISKDCVKMFKGLSHTPTVTSFSFPNYPRRLIEILDSFKPYFTDKRTKEVKYPSYIDQIRISVQADLNPTRFLDEERTKRIERKSPFFMCLQAMLLSLEYLRSIMLADTVFAMGSFLPYDLNLEKRGTLYMDAQALESLEIVSVNYLTSQAEAKSFFGYMDHTVTGFGKRMLKRWITAPLIDSEKIQERQDAVEDLIKNNDVADYFHDQLARMPDLERIISRVYNLSNRKRLSAVYFEDFAKNRLKDFMKLLTDLKGVEEIVEAFGDYLQYFTSKRLIQLASFRDIDMESFVNKRPNKSKLPKIGIFPRINHIIQDLENKVRVQNDLPIPVLGVSKEIDLALEKIEKVTIQLNEILEKYRREHNCPDLKYVSAKYKYELEYPEHKAPNPRPKDFVLTSKRQGFIRFITLQLEELVQKLWVLECEFQKHLVSFISDYFRMFYERHAYWQQVIACLGELDCLCSLAKLARKMEFKCRPEVLPMGDERTFELEGIIHPPLAKNNPNFIPNDIIYNSSTQIFLITGPNMGGKSTLLREACLSIIMAQVGSYVPATRFRMNAFDRIFTRIGAQDRILEGKSTFYVEMEETQRIVSEATKNSFLIIDELGRGTSTYDGVAIAYSTLKYIANKIKCLTMFSTHYHLLVEEFKLYKNIEAFHMESKFIEETNEIHFLYKFIKGHTDKSRGLVIAKVAGFPEGVLKRAKEKSEMMTKEKKNIGLEVNMMSEINGIFDILKDENSSKGNVDLDIYENLEKLVNQTLKPPIE